MTNLVEMKGIEKRFPGVHALKDVQFDLRPGEVHALMGENGAGKSTLMKIMSGIYARDGGEMLVDGKPAAPDGPRAAQDLGIGIIHQELSLMNDLTAAQNVLIGREPRRRFGRLDEAALNAQTAEIFASLNLKMDPRTQVSTQTIARQQLIEIAKALSYSPRVLIMDEPTAALNDTEINELFKVIDKLKNDGVGIVYISHRMDEIKRIADRVTILRDGAYIDTVQAADTPLSTIIQLMVGREVTQDTPDIPDTSQSPVALEVRNLSRGSEVRDVSFNVRKGEILGFAGLMGAGRTEVARIIFGADPRDSGEILVHEQPVNIRTPHTAVQAGIGYLSEDRKHFGLAVDMTVRANIAMADLGRFAGRSGVLNETAMERVALEYIDRLGIRTPSDMQEVRFLSGGNQQKVVIAKWLLRDCDILIFDEPTRGIDIGAKSEIYALLEDLAAQGRAIIVISSELPEILRLSHRIAVMCEGRLTGIVPREEATQENIMKLATQTDGLAEQTEETTQ
ncbi:sugar ABC transporter ATP-binding protein [Octadecabacter sp. 1_MG-2023]|uniref:sugar ABC transporter ATP-binding protein n=1 Tax=unclassified Octadecabacter TaxID=196158 RepID=UPI001C08EC4A|nr:MULTISPECIES: sugar ABC transporter ATP-binding protein [unclassified Octadecabacter]MBU2994563.1 sugar ABC transporter ATP-binding protein [Octadecabacter sp. B2R22]MDO6734144.1 sugar ABC transporter ATP-binding protein [Octadecabacter sp. 1_MG-2023]